jgi:hypothetical protein
MRERPWCNANETERALNGLFLQEAGRDDVSPAVNRGARQKEVTNFYKMARQVIASIHALLYVADDEARMPAMSGGKREHVLLVVMRFLANHERIDLRGWHTESGSGRICAPLRLRERKARSRRAIAVQAIDHCRVLTVAIQHVLDLVAHDEPEVVDGVPPRRNPRSLFDPPIALRLVRTPLARPAR